MMARVNFERIIAELIGFTVFTILDDYIVIVFNRGFQWKWGNYVHFVTSACQRFHYRVTDDPVGFTPVDGSCVSGFEGISRILFSPRWKNTENFVSINEEHL
jgi:hypothetical protein